MPIDAARANQLAGRIDRAIGFHIELTPDHGDLFILYQHVRGIIIYSGNDPAVLNKDLHCSPLDLCSHLASRAYPGVRATNPSTFWETWLLRQMKFRQAN